MTRKYLQNLAYALLLVGKFDKSHFTQNILTLPLIATLFLSWHLYSAWGGFANTIIESFTALLGIYLWLRATPKQSFILGFALSLSWFWWIALSFRYYDLIPFVPFVLLAIGITYGLIFWLIGNLPSPLLKGVVIIFGFDIIAPFGFDWFKPELVCVDTLCESSKLSFSLVVLSLALILAYPKKFTLSLAMVCIIGSTLIPHPTGDLPPLRIATVETSISQEELWKKSSQPLITQQSLTLIDDAIAKGYDIIILPESAFPYLLHTVPTVMQQLKEKSDVISIVAGSIFYDEKTSSLYNSAYYFHDGNVTIASKVVLVPFGEKIPLPSFFQEWLNTHIFQGASDYKTAPHPTDISLRGSSFRNAICYEATSDELYANNPRFMIALSNNGWFLPSFEPLLQRKLLTLQAKRHGTTIFHSVNGSHAYVIRP